MNKNKEFGFFSKSFADRDNGKAIDAFASHKNNVVVGLPINSDRFNAHKIFSYSFGQINLLNLEIKNDTYQFGFIFDDLNLFKKNKIGLKAIFGYDEYDSKRTQLNNTVSTGKETINTDYYSFSSIIGTQLQRNYNNGYIKTNLDTSFERFINHRESDNVTWNSRLLGQFMGDITYGWKNEYENRIFLNPEVTFGYRTMINGKNQKYQANGNKLSFNGGVQEDVFGKLGLIINYSFKENTNLFLETSAKKTTEDQETFVMNIGFKSVF